MLELTLAANAAVRELEPWHAAEFAAYVAADREHLMPWIRFAHTVIDEVSAARFLNDYAELRRQDKGRFYGLWLDGRLSGGGWECGSRAACDRRS